MDPSNGSPFMQCPVECPSLLATKVENDSSEVTAAEQPIQIEPNEEDKRFKEEKMEPGGSAVPSLVASHYNAIPEVGIQRRMDSRILHLRNMNNWMKSMLIGDFLERLGQEGCSRARVMDLACGKGGDLRKWRIGNIGHILMTDIADVSLQDCRDRYERMADRRSGRLPFKAHFVQADLTQANLRELLPPQSPAQFDLASCQFALHYSFRSESSARRMLQNCTDSLRPGGYFIGTVTSACAVMHFLRPSNGHFANQVCSLSTTSSWASPSSGPSAVPPLFGAEFRFRLEGVVDCPEYLCYLPLLKRLLEELGLELVYEFDFPSAIDHYLAEKGSEGLELMRRMDALETVRRDRLEGKDAGEYGPALARLSGPEGGGDQMVGTLSRSEWEVLSLYRVFAFRKLPIDANNPGLADEQRMEKEAGGEQPQNSTERERSPH